MPIYNKVEIGRIAQQHGFVRDTFEKVLRLKEILRYLNEEEYLREHLLLKGGTAINLTIFNLPRLSVDIDMDYTPNDTKEDMLEAREKITVLIKDYMDAEGYQLSKGSRFTHSLEAFYYQYQNAGGNRDMIKIELNYSLRAHILEPVHRKILPKVFDDGLEIRMVAPMEIFAAKGNALISRAAARDLFPILSKKDNFMLDERKQQAKDYIANLMQLTEREQEYMDRFIAKEYVSELLFDDKEIVDRIKKHPMALWKCQQ